MSDKKRDKNLKRIKKWIGVALSIGGFFVLMTVMMPLGIFLMKSGYDEHGIIMTLVMLGSATIYCLILSKLWEPDMPHTKKAMEQWRKQKRNRKELMKYVRKSEKELDKMVSEAVYPERELMQRRPRFLVSYKRIKKRKIKKPRYRRTISPESFYQLMRTFWPLGVIVAMTIYLVGMGIILLPILWLMMHFDISFTPEITMFVFFGAAALFIYGIYRWQDRKEFAEKKAKKREKRAAVKMAAGQGNKKDPWEF